MDFYFHTNFKKKSHIFIMHVYDTTEFFPKTELYGTISQLRRAAVSVMLNFVEGYARFKPKVKLNFFEISYGSAQECNYLIYLAYERKWITQKDYKYAHDMLDELLAVLWSMINKQEKIIGESV